MKPNWSDWRNWKLVLPEHGRRRDPMLKVSEYGIEFDDNLGALQMVTADLPKFESKSSLAGLMASTRRRLWRVMDWMSLQYSAGADISQLKEVWPFALTWAEEYAGFSHRFNQSPEAHGRIVAHVALRTEDYWIVALRLICFGLLTGNGSEMQRVMVLLDYASDERDGLLERLTAPFCPGRGDPPDTFTRHLPYRKLLKVFNAAPEVRPPLMAKYLDEWYEASRREPYFDQHESLFYGYWSWEAAAVTWLLDIDDSSYRDKNFYPRDLVDFARSSDPPPSRGGQIDAGSDETVRLRCPAGEPCPRSGYWFTPARQDARRHFQQGEVMPEVQSDYGVTIWQWDRSQ